MDHGNDLYKKASQLSEEGRASEAWSLYLESAEYGNAESQYYVGKAYQSGDKIPQDIHKAEYWYQKAAMQNHTDACWELVFLYNPENGIQKDLEKYFQIMKYLADTGDLYACYTTGKNYLNGVGTEQNYGRAAYYYKIAADKGDTEAQFYLGTLYDRGLGVPEDPIMAMKYFQSAGTHVSNAQNWIGYHFYEGRGIPQDYEKAAFHYQIAADLGNICGLYNLGFCYLRGEGVEQDTEKGLKLLFQSANSNRPDSHYAKCLLGKLYQEGEYVPKDPEKALAFYKSAADLNDEEAAANYNKLSKSIMISKAKSISETEFDHFIGLNNVKEQIMESAHLLQFLKLRKLNNKPITTQPSMHMIFAGNPGTGKTTAARLVGKIYYELGLIEKPNVIEVDCSSLVAGYVGQTALKTQEKIEEALGGILFVDEAYMLSRSTSDNDYGQEAIDTLNKAMEDHRDHLMVIASGYTCEMEDFIKSNPGLKSRFKTIIYFNDYTPEELSEIFFQMISRDQYVLEDGVNTLVSDYFKRCWEKGYFKEGNARFVRNFYQDILGKLATRLYNSSFENEDCIMCTDVKAAIDSYKNDHKFK